MSTTKKKTVERVERELVQKLFYVDKQSLLPGTQIEYIIHQDLRKIKPLMGFTSSFCDYNLRHFTLNLSLLILFYTPKELYTLSQVTYVPLEELLYITDVPHHPLTDKGQQWIDAITIYMNDRYTILLAQNSTIYNFWLDHFETIHFRSTGRSVLQRFRTKSKIMVALQYQLQDHRSNETNNPQSQQTPQKANKNQLVDLIIQIQQTDQLEQEQILQNPKTSRQPSPQVQQPNQTTISLNIQNSQPTPIQNLQAIQIHSHGYNKVQKEKLRNISEVPLQPESIQTEQQIIFKKKICQIPEQTPLHKIIRPQTPQSIRRPPSPQSISRPLSPRIQDEMKIVQKHPGRLFFNRKDTSLFHQSGREFSNDKEQNKHDDINSSQKNQPKFNETQPIIMNRPAKKYNLSCYEQPIITTQRKQCQYIRDIWQTTDQEGNPITRPKTMEENFTGRSVIQMNTSVLANKEVLIDDDDDEFDEKGFLKELLGISIVNLKVALPLEQEQQVKINVDEFPQQQNKQQVKINEDEFKMDWSMKLNNEKLSKQIVLDKKLSKPQQSNSKLLQMGKIDISQYDDWDD